MSVLSLRSRSVHQLALTWMLQCELMQPGALQHSSGQRLPRPAAAQAKKPQLPIHHRLFYTRGQLPEVPAGIAAQCRRGSIVCSHQVNVHVQLFWI